MSRRIFKALTIVAASFTTIGMVPELTETSLSACDISNSSGCFPLIEQVLSTEASGNIGEHTRSESMISRSEAALNTESEALTDPSLPQTSKADHASAGVAPSRS